MSLVTIWAQELGRSENLGSGNLGSGNLGSGNLGSGNLGSGNLGSGNLGSGNLGSGNLGSGRNDQAVLMGYLADAARSSSEIAGCSPLFS